MKKSIGFADLNKKLITHYKLFNNETLWLDAYGESSGTCIVCCHTYTNISFMKCKQVAKYVKTLIPWHMFTYIYVGPFHFIPNEL